MTRDIRLWLERRYRVDVSGVSDEDVVARAATILGLTRSASPSQTAALVSFRLDADREYERDEGGKFASTGGGSSHADEAKEHAERARAAASGTTPAARASARKAEDHAEQAAKAHASGDFDKAASHAAEAKKHSEAAIAKANVSKGLPPNAGLVKTSSPLSPSVKAQSADAKVPPALAWKNAKAAEPATTSKPVVTSPLDQEAMAKRALASSDHIVSQTHEAMDMARKALSKGDLNMAQAHLDQIGKLRDANDVHIRVAAEAAMHAPKHPDPQRESAADEAARLTGWNKESINAIHAEIGQNLHSARESAKAISDAQTSGSTAPMGHAEYNHAANAFEDKVTRDQAYAFRTYSFATDQAINRMLRETGGKLDITKAVNNRGEQMADKFLSSVGEMNKAIAATPLPRDTLVYRVLQDKDGGMFKSLKPGAVFQDHGFMSTTADKGVLNEFYRGPKAERVDMHITLKQGSGAAPMNNLSQFQGERELLLGSGQKLKVTKVTSENGVHTIHAERL